MGRKKTGLDTRILKEADRLFYFQGYTNTGINQLVQEAGTNKPGLYSYFEGKEEVARLYLSARNEEIVDTIIEFGRRSKDVPEFFRLWMNHVKETARGPSYNGCAVANFASQTRADDQDMQKFIKATGRKWESRLIAYLRSEIRSGRFPAKPGAAAIARRMLTANEGAITMWQLTGRTAYFDEAVRMFEISLRMDDE